MALFRTARRGRTLAGGIFAIILGGAILVQSLAEGNLQNAGCGGLLMLAGFAALGVFFFFTRW